MSITAYKRGHHIKYTNGQWFYSDNGDSILIERSCIKCNKMPTQEGHDACLGHILNVKSACCGHGIEPPIIMENNYE